MNNILFFAIEAIIGMRRSAMMIVISKITILVSLLIFGLFLIVNMNLLSFSKFISNKLEVKIYLNEGLTKREIQSFYEILKMNESVKSVEFLDKDSSWGQFKDLYPQLALNSYIVTNPLPHTFIIKLHDSKQLDNFSGMVKAYSKYCEKVIYGGGQGEKLQKISGFIFYAGWCLVGILSLATFLIMMNTITLTIINRNEEIGIMKLVGATDGFIIAPFVLEALILGVSSSFISVILLDVSYKVFLAKVAEYLPYLPIAYSSSDLISIYLYVFLWGIFLSGFAAFLSLRGTLRKII